MGVADGTGEVRELTSARLPITLSPQLHDRLSDWCRQAADGLQVTALARGEVLEALLAELVADPATAAAVRLRLRARLATPRARPWRGTSPSGRPRGLGR